MATEFISNSWLMPTNANAEANRVSNYSLTFNGTDNYINCGNDSIFSFSTDMSASAWVNTSQTTVGNIFSKTYYRLEFAANGILSWGVYETSSSSTFVYSTTAINDGQWHHIVVTHKANGNQNIYVDGQLEGTASAKTGIHTTTHDFFIGRRNATHSRIMDGNLTTIALWNTELTSSQVTDLYGTGSAIGNPMAITNGRKPVAYYPLGNAAFNGEFLASNGAEQDYVFDFAGSAKIEYATPVDLGVVSTFSFWMNIDTGTTGALFGNTLLGTYEYIVYYSGSAFYFKIAGAYADFPNAAAAISTGQWHHVAFVRPSQNEVKCYIDSVLTDTITSWSGTPGSNPIKFDLIGSRPGGGLDYSGKMAQISGFNTALPATGTESVASLYNYGTPPNIASYSGLQGWWELDASATFDGSNWSIPDASSNSNTGTSSGMTAANLVQSDLIINAPYDSFSLSFDGANDYIELNTSSISFANSFCISMWIKPDSVSGFQMLFGGSGYAGGNGIGHYIYNNTIWTYVAVGGSATAIFQSSALLNIGDWTHIIIQRTASVKWEMWVDGVLNQSNSSDILTDDLTSANSRIARHYNNATYNFDGCISNTSIYSSALTAAQVQTLYNEHKPFNLNNFEVTPVSWWRLGASGSSFDGTNWTVLDEIGISNGTSANMTQTDLVDGVGATGNGVSSGMSSGTNRSDAPYSSNNAVSYNMSVLAKSTSVPT